MSRTKNYLSGLATGYAVTFTTIAVGLWLTPFTLQFLNREEYAIFTLAGDMLMWLGLLDIGISSGLSVQAAQLAGKPDAERLNRLASTAFFTQNIISVVIFIIGCTLAISFPNFFKINPALNQQAILVTILMVTGVAINIFVQTFSSLLIANQQVYIDNLIKISLVLIRTVFTVIFLLMGWKMMALATANLIAVIITASLAVLRVWRLLPSLQISMKWYSWDVLKSTGQLGIWFSLGGLAGIVITSLDRIVTAKIISIELVTTLSLTGRLYVLFGGLLQQITNISRPMLGQLLGNGKIELAFERYRQIFLFSTGATIIIAAVIFSINNIFIRLWVGEENYGGFWLDAALALNMVTHAWVLPNRAILSSNLIVRPQTLSRLVEGALNIILSIFLAKLLGVIGVVFSTAIAGILTSNWYLPFLTSKMFNRSNTKFWLGDGLRLILFALLIFLIALVIRMQLDESVNYLNQISAALFVSLVGASIFYFFVLEINFRKSTIVQIRRILGVDPR